ncbi:MAG: ABC transporter permease [Eubacteriales bacterium]|jgi:putative ABC transport system permease protein
MKHFSLMIRNLTRRPGRTTALILLTAFLAISVFCGTIVVSSLRHGLDSMENRLGADIIVVPAEAESKVSMKNLLLQGTIGTFYMDASALKKVQETEGVGRASAQVFLSSMKADCCSVKVQIIGFDPENDFVVQPWISESLNRPLSDMEVVVGCRVETDVGNNFRIYDRSCRVAAKLASTGTGLDTAVYCNMNTIHILLQAAEEKGISHKIDTGNDSDVVSAIYVKVLPGADPGVVNNRLNGHIRKATAIRTAGMITEVADSLSGVSRTIAVLIIAVWVLALIILLIVFSMMVNERRRELAVYRLLGMSRKMLSGMILKEAALCSFTGALCGTAVGAVLVFPFTTLIETSLKLPYLTPDGGTVILYACIAIAVTILAGCVASARTASALSRVDPGTTLREGA